MKKTHFSGSIHIYCDNPDNPGLWTKLVIKSKQVMSEDDGSADYGLVPCETTYLCTDDFSGAQGKLPNKIWLYISQNPYVPPPVIISYSNIKGL